MLTPQIIDLPLKKDGSFCQHQGYIAWSNNVDKNGRIVGQCSECSLYVSRFGNEGVFFCSSCEGYKVGPKDEYLCKECRQ